MQLQKNLALERCPHCSIARPHLDAKANFDTENHSEDLKRHWVIYVCASCGGVVSAWSLKLGMPVIEHFPSISAIDDAIPVKPRELLRQAKESLHAPAGAIMLAASSVDSMLKLKSFVDGSLYSRIEKAAAEHLITDEMARWAHQIRLDANDQRHADQEASLPTEEEAKLVIDFASALAQFLFVLPARVTRGIAQADKA